MNYDDYKLATPVYELEPDESPERCELCELDAVQWVDIDPVRNPGRYMAHLCAGCADFERARINKEIKSTKLFNLKHND